MCNKPEISYYSYIVVAETNILFAGTVFVEKNQVSSNFSFPIITEMSSGAQIIVFTILCDEVLSDLESYRVKEDFTENLRIEFSSEILKPGEDVDIDVCANNQAFVGLLGVDKAVIVDNNENDLKLSEALHEKSNFFNATHRRQSGIRYYDRATFRNCSLQFITNIDYEMEFRCMLKKRCIKKKKGPKGEITEFECVGEGGEDVVIREDFPETWIWESICDDDFNGKRILKRKVPDSITEYVLTAFSIDPEVGLSILNEPKILKVFQPFFVSIQLPYSIKRGETVIIPFTVFNYQDFSISAELIIQNEFNDYEFIEPIENDQKTNKIQLNISANGNKTIRVSIKPKKVGKIPIKAIAMYGEISDGMMKPLIVEPEGTPQYINKSILIDLREKQEFDPTTVSIEVLPEAVPDSTRVEVHCVGDLLGGTIKNLERLIRLPTGCGEQNMMSFVPNIVILNYLKNTCQLTEEIKNKIEKFTNVGYQRELSYRLYDGSFSCFGIRDKRGSTWLTAFVARSFREAANYVAIDERIIESSLDWLANNQTDEGEFLERGYVWHSVMQGMALTAYVLVTFLENKHQYERFNSTIEKSIKYIEKHHLEIESVHALGIINYALQFTDSPIKAEIFERFLKHSHQSNGLMWWEGRNSSESSNVELTGYGLLALLKSEASNNEQCLSVMKWLLTQRNSRGGFVSTQDTVIGLDALAKYAERISSKNRDIIIEFEGGNTKEMIEVNDTNALLRQSHLVRTKMQ